MLTIATFIIGLLVGCLVTCIYIEWGRDNEG